MKVSVIVPVYNNIDYLEESVLSALPLNEVREIILIDDGSTDGSRTFCLKLDNQYPKVKFITSHKHKKTGRSYARNIGIQQSHYSWIAFLDADDTFLPNRFDELQKLEPFVDGLYQPVQTHFMKERYRETFPEEITSIRTNIKPESLFRFLVTQENERISIIGLTIKKEALISIDGFDESLNTGEDTDLIWRLALKKKLIGSLDNQPVSIRRVHGKNSYFYPADINYGRYRFYRKWAKSINNLSKYPEVQRTIRRKYLHYIPAVKKREQIPFLPQILKVFYFFLSQLRIYP